MTLKSKSSQSSPNFKQLESNEKIWYNTSQFPTTLTDEEEALLLLLRGIKGKSTSMLLDMLATQEEGEEEYYEFLKECAMHKPTFTKSYKALTDKTDLKSLVAKAVRDVKAIENKEDLMSAMKTLYVVYLKV